MELTKKEQSILRISIPNFVDSLVLLAFSACCVWLLDDFTSMTIVTFPNEEGVMHRYAAFTI